MRACTSSSTGIATWSLKVRRPGARAAAMAGPSRGGQARLPARGPQQAAIVDTVPRCRCDGIRHRRAPSNRSSLSRGSATSVRSRRSPNAEDGIWRRKGSLVVAMGGSKNVTRFLKMFGPQGLDVRLAGLCDAAEGDFNGLEQAGGSDLTRADLERLGFFVCVADLEDELIRSAPLPVERVVTEQGDLVSFRTFQRQPEWRGRSVEDAPALLRHVPGRKIRSAPALVEALDLRECLARWTRCSPTSERRTDRRGLPRSTAR